MSPSSGELLSRPIDKGLLKIFFQDGHLDAASYCGAQIFEALGLGQEIIDRYFSGRRRASAVSIWRRLEEENLMRHRAGVS